MLVSRVAGFSRNAARDAQVDAEQDGWEVGLAAEHLTVVLEPYRDGDAHECNQQGSAPDQSTVVNSVNRDFPRVSAPSTLVLS